jgi:hypothetical protein
MWKHLFAKLNSVKEELSNLVVCHHWHGNTHTFVETLLDKIEPVGVLKRKGSTERGREVIVLG